MNGWVGWLVNRGLHCCCRKSEESRMVALARETRRGAGGLYKLSIIFPCDCAKRWSMLKALFATVISSKIEHIFLMKSNERGSENGGKRKKKWNGNEWIIIIIIIIMDDIENKREKKEYTLIMMLEIIWIFLKTIMVMQKFPTFIYLFIYRFIFNILIFFHIWDSKDAALNITISVVRNGIVDPISNPVWNCLCFLWENYECTSTPSSNGANILALIRQPLPEKENWIKSVLPNWKIVLQSHPLQRGW